MKCQNRFSWKIGKNISKCRLLKVLARELSVNIIFVIYVSFSLQLHRMVVYDDYHVHFDTEDLFLHGTFQDATCQRHVIFTGKR